MNFIFSHFGKIFYWVLNSRLTYFFSFNNLRALFHCLLTATVSIGKLLTPSHSFFEVNVVFFICILLDMSRVFFKRQVRSSFSFGKILTNTSASAKVPFSFPSGTIITCTLYFFLCHRYLTFVLFFLILSSLCFSLNLFVLTHLFG